jgi:BolA protein
VTDARLDRIKDRLHVALAPTRLDVVDDSHRHVGHAGAKDGRGHFTAVIVSARFSGLSKIERHRLVFEVLDDLMATDIHAISIHAFAPGER